MSDKLPEGWSLHRREPPPNATRTLPGIGPVTDEEWFIFHIGRMRGILEARGVDPDDPELRARVLANPVEISPEILDGPLLPK